ncbi:hypothetical protein GA0074695_3793 [Micromonospora viridifaciens]|uniref:Uncharacterized protein n=1 Tax=Micromonospora viridifaciens TaxID=1881 RepID=A0A1C4Y1W3_MICVI|nr:hypothetical protein [Micromonospora viridifaciens]SCF14704.1 hypothetical protein GA0074695_3793 [Micromonospora viridifaciens]
MTTEAPLRRATTGTLDYYLLHAAAEDVQPIGLLVEEFVLADDLSATRLRSAGWTAAPVAATGHLGVEPLDGGWWSSAAFARAVRTDRQLRARLAATDRATAEATYHRLGGGALPGDEALRDHFHDDVPLASGAPLRLGTGTDVHRVLFAGELDDRRLERLSRQLRLAAPVDPPATRPGVIGTGRLRVNDTNARWDLQRVGGAWCIDVTSTPPGRDALRWLLRQLTDLARGQGLVPATIDRLG